MIDRFQNDFCSAMLPLRAVARCAGHQVVLTVPLRRRPRQMEDVAVSPIRYADGLHRRRREEPGEDCRFLEHRAPTAPEGVGAGAGAVDRGVEVPLHRQPLPRRERGALSSARRVGVARLRAAIVEQAALPPSAAETCDRCQSFLS